MSKGSFEFKPFSRKQKKLLYWWEEGSPKRGNKIVIAHGSVRSGKTIAMICGFFHWSMATYKDKGGEFILAGKTVGALKRNVIKPAKQILDAWGIEYKYVGSGDSARLEVGKLTFYFFDAHNEKSQDKLQGLTASGALADEVALFPQSFVEQMIARCSVAGAKLWFNCNPESPSHFVKTELIDQAGEKNVYVLHFTMDDNLALPEETRLYFKSAFTGVFYRRFIEGEWALTDGLVYQQFADDWQHYVVDELPQIRYATIGVDFGGTGSAHSFTLMGFTDGFRKIGIIDEYYHDNKKSGILNPEQLNQAFVDFVRRAKSRYRVAECYCDSAEQTLIQGFRVAARRAGLAIDIKNAIKGPINDRIAFFNSMIAQDRFFVHSSCKAAQKAMRDAVYDSKTGVRLDDGTTNIDSLDSMEYSVETLMHDILFLGLRR